MTRLRPVHARVAAANARRCRERGIVIPTFRQLRDPGLIPAATRRRLRSVPLDATHPLNLFRIGWKNDPRTGGFGAVNRFELPAALTGVKARIVGLVGAHFPTGAHKVGAAFGCLVPRLVTGEFDPRVHRAVWPSTGNFCRGGVFDCALLGCAAVAVLPEGMSRERFEWLRRMGATVHATPGSESNVKEIYDKCRELRADPACVIFNQFEEFGNPIFHYQVTGPAIEEVLLELGGGVRPAVFVSATGSAGTIAAGDFLKRRHPGLRIVAAEALQCPTLLQNGYGSHRIEGIGDKHVPWVHHVRSTDAVAAIDDEDCVRIARLFNEPAGRARLRQGGVPAGVVERLPLLGISGICNLLAAIKAAKSFELAERDVIFTIFTDSMRLYRSRLAEWRAQRGPYRPSTAAADFAGPLAHQSTDHFKELSQADRKAIHHLKYYTWVEQQGKTAAELDRQWDDDYWQARFEGADKVLDASVEAFNRSAAG